MPSPGPGACGLRPALQVPELARWTYRHCSHRGFCTCYQSPIGFEHVSAEAVKVSLVVSKLVFSEGAIRTRPRMYGFRILIEKAHGFASFLKYSWSG